MKKVTHNDVLLTLELMKKNTPHEQKEKIQELRNTINEAIEAYKDRKGTVYTTRKKRPNLGRFAVYENQPGYKSETMIVDSD